jgi:hypothetical protein
VQLPDDILARLREAQAASIAVRDVFWLPKHHVTWFPGDHDRFCVVVGLEAPAGGGPPRVQLIAGTSHADTRPIAVHVPANTIELKEDTYFLFRYTGSLPASVVVADGKPRGRLGEEWHAALDKAVKASKLAEVKRLWIP